MNSRESLLRVTILLVLPFAANADRLQEPARVPAEKASVIVSGAVSKTLALVRADKLTGSERTLPNGQKIAELPRPSEYYLGTIYQFRVDDVLKGNKMAHVGQTINVFVPGLVNASDRIALSSRHKYLLQLMPLGGDAKNYEGTAIMDLAKPSGKQKFDPNIVFAVTGGFDGAVPITEANKALIERIRHEAKRR